MRAPLTGGVLGVALALGQALDGVAAAGPGSFVIAAGASPIYQEAARALCRVVNRHAAGLRCEALATPDFAFNLSNVAGGALELALVPADLQHHAFAGSGPFAFMDVPHDNLRALFSLHAEVFTLVARRDAGIGSLGALAGKRVNLGAPGTPARRWASELLAAIGLAAGDLKLLSELPAAEQSLALCHDRIEAAAYWVAHPDDGVAQTLELCHARLVRLPSPAIERLVAKWPYLSAVTLPGGLYAGESEPVPTFGVRATVVSAAEVPAELVHAVVEAVLGEPERLRALHRVFAELAPERMASEGLSAPLHEGVRRYHDARRSP